MADARPALSLTAVPVEQVSQVNSDLCWAACCEVMARFYRCPIASQFQIAVAQKVFKTTDSEKLNRQGDDSDVVLALQDMLPTVKSIRYVATPVPLRFSHDMIKRFLDGGRIMLFAYGQHVRVLCGYGTRGSEEVIAVLDPAFGRVTVAEWSEFDTCRWVVYVPKAG